MGGKFDRKISWTNWVKELGQKLFEENGWEKFCEGSPSVPQFGEWKLFQAPNCPHPSRGLQKGCRGMEWNLVVGDPKMEWKIVVGDPKMEWNFNPERSVSSSTYFDVARQLISMPAAQQGLTAAGGEKIPATATGLWYRTAQKDAWYRTALIGWGSWIPGSRHSTGLLRRS